jgi:spore coat polysaccharide biosynthesis protein SpsF
MLAVIVSARSSSSRLPNKALLKIKDDICAIEIVIERAKMIGLPVILATSTDDSDNKLSEIGKKHNIQIFRGELQNKIKRWYDCFNKFEIETAIEIDGDDLCYNYDLAKKALNEFRKTKDMMVAPSNLIIGFFTYIISKNGMGKLFSVAKDENLDTDVITKFIEKGDLQLQTLVPKENEVDKNIRLTLDYDEDLKFFRKIYEKFDILTPTSEIVNYLLKNPELTKINFDRQADFLNNQAKFNANIK